jgi:hypothetical protein
MAQPSRSTQLNLPTPTLFFDELESYHAELACAEENEGALSLRSCSLSLAQPCQPCTRNDLDRRVLSYIWIVGGRLEDVYSIVFLGLVFLGSVANSARKVCLNMMEPV